MGKIRITADSTCDLSESLLQKYEISILPLNIVLDMKSYSEGEEISPDEIYAWSEKMHKTPQTASVAYDRALEMAYIEGQERAAERIEQIKDSDDYEEFLNSDEAVNLLRMLGVDFT